MQSERDKQAQQALIDKRDSIVSSVIDSISTNLTARACSCTTTGVSSGFVRCRVQRAYNNDDIDHQGDAGDGPAIRASAVSISKAVATAL